ncbi:MAG: hypothetical protein RLZZ252_1833 [Bacteroidota bacterium]
MIRFFFVFILWTISSIPAHAQTVKYLFCSYCDIVPGDTFYVAKSTATLKSKPLDNSKPLASLSLGDMVIVTTTSPSKSTGKGSGTYPNSSLETRYKTENSLDFLPVTYQGKSGYIATGALGIAKLHTQVPKTYFIVKSNFMGSTTNDSLTIFEISDNQIVNEYSTLIFGSLISISVNGNAGLDSVTHLLRIDYYSEACGDESGMTYFTWNPQDLKLLGHLAASADPESQYGEAFYFPSDVGGAPGKVIFRAETYEIFDETTNWTRRSVEERVFTWSQGYLTPAFKSEE